MSVEKIKPLTQKDDQLRVSIAIPTYKRANMIRETLSTVVNQSFRDIEILVKADGLDDETEDIVYSMKDSRIRFSRSEERLGMPGIMNEIIQETRGEYVLVLHDHDFYHQDLVGCMVKELDSNPDALYAHTALEIVDTEKQPILRYVGDYKGITKGRDWLKYMLSRFDCPVCAMSMVRRSAYEKYGLYDEAYGFVSDVEMWMRLSRHGDVIYLPKVLMSCRGPGERNHEYYPGNWSSVAAIIQIHERYLREEGMLASTWERLGFGYRCEYMRMINFCSLMKKSRFARRSRLDAKKGLEAQGGPFTSVFAKIIPV